MGYFYSDSQVLTSGERNVLTTRMEDFIVDISHDMFLDPDPQKNANTPVNVSIFDQHMSISFMLDTLIM